MNLRKSTILVLITHNHIESRHFKIINEIILQQNKVKIENNEIK